jgi:hypothetical protein
LAVAPDSAQSGIRISLLTRVVAQSYSHQAFLKEFDIPGVSFLPQKISEGDNAVAFTW